MLYVTIGNKKMKQHIIITKKRVGPGPRVLTDIGEEVNTFDLLDFSVSSTGSYTNDIYCSFMLLTQYTPISKIF